MSYRDPREEPWASVTAGNIWNAPGNDYRCPGCGQKINAEERITHATKRLEGEAAHTACARRMGYKVSP